MAWQVSEYKPEYCEIAASVLAGGESLAAVCAELNCCRKTLYNWRDAHPEFADALHIGLQKAQRDWEALGRSGIQGDIDKFSASPWIFTMKNRFRDDYQDDKKEEKSTSESLLEKIISGDIKVK
jgi:hypothetical protein